jgi:hypothetical protein
MRADHNAPSGAANGGDTLVSSPREAAPGLRALVDDVLRAAVAAERNSVPFAAGIAHRDPLGELCAAARANDVRAETLILAIKDAWRRFPESHAPSRLDSDVMLATVVTKCIREYYGPRRS